MNPDYLCQRAAGARWLLPRWLFWLILIVLSGPLLPGAAAASEQYAVVVGVNEARRRTTPTLRYADDDAILFHQVISRAGKSILLVTPDDATLRVHSEVRGARPPTRANLEAALTEVFAAVRDTRARGGTADFYFIYSGHGDVDHGQGHLALADGRLTAEDLERLVLSASPAQTNHVIIDACRSYYLVHEKGPGGQRRRIGEFFHRTGNLAERFPGTGFLLSTSSAAASHEWEQFQAGVFSHEVRSGLLGPADVDRDGLVSYDEIWAFIQVANARIPNERYQPRIWIHPPEKDGSRTLLDLRRLQGQVVTIPPARAGRYYVEDRLGIRLLDLHAAPSSPVVLRLPVAARLYIHDVGRGKEYVLEPRRRRVALASIASRSRSVRSKGAAHEAFTRIFEEPFGLEAYKVQLDCARAVGSGSDCPSYRCRRCRCSGCNHLGAETKGVAGVPAGKVTGRPSAPRARQRIFTLALATYALWNRYAVVDPALQQYALDMSTRAVPCFGVNAELFFGELFSRRLPLLSSLGLVFEFYHSVGLEMRTHEFTLQARLWQLEGGLRYRWKVLDTPRSPTLTFGVLLGQRTFDVDESPDGMLTPDPRYLYGRLELVGLRVPLVPRRSTAGWPFWLDLVGGLDFLIAEPGGRLHRYGQSGYGGGTVLGLKGGGGLELGVGLLFVRLEGVYQRFATDFDQDCAICRIAGGALDETYGILLGTGVGY